MSVILGIKPLIKYCIKLFLLSGLVYGLAFTTKIVFPHLMDDRVLFFCFGALYGIWSSDE